MKIKALLGFLLVTICALFLYGCGGGGGTGTTTAVGKTAVSGVASKGIIKNGTIKIFALNPDGSKGALLATATTDLSGSYQANIGNYSGPILIEASGSYVDEATGVQKTIPATAPLRAALANATGNVSTAVTPLTELAVHRAALSGLTAANITASNAIISSLFKLDINGTLPVEPVAAVFGSASTTQEQRDYTLALAALSQMASTAGSIDAVLNEFELDIEADDNLNATMTAGFQSALAAFLAAGTTINQTGATSTSTNLATVGGKTAVVHLSTSGQLPAGTTINGVQTTLNIPAGATVAYDRLTNEILAGAITLSNLVPTGALFSAKFNAVMNAADVALISTTGFGTGEFATITCDIPAGTTVSASGFSLANSKIVDKNGAVIGGITLGMTVTIN